MKIAEALVSIKDLKGKVAELQRNIQSDSTFEKLDENTAVPFIEEDIVELLRLTKELGELKSRVAVTNATHGITRKINEMEQLRSNISQLEGLTRVKQSHTRLQRYLDRADKVEVVATFDVESMKNKVEAMRKRVRELDLELQKLNWQIDVE